jgi:glucan-binding YG repeat protein
MCCLSRAKAEDTGWVKKDGYWYYYSSQNTYYTDGVYYIGNNKYYFDSMGIMQANKWVSYYGDWLYAGPGGELVTGWKKINNKWYWFDSWGYLCPREGGPYKIDGKTYLFDKNGALIQFRSGWYELSITNSSGGTEKYGFTLNAEGVVCAGWAKYEYVYSYGESTPTYWYCLDASGDQMNGWQKINGKWYYFDETENTLCFYPNGGVFNVDGVLYYFAESGANVQGERGWRKSIITEYDYSREVWYYLLESGRVSTGWTVIDGKTYYFSETTGCLSPGEDSSILGWVDYRPYDIDGVTYIFRQDSSLLTGKAGWVECEYEEGYDYIISHNYGYTIDNNGAVQPGWTRTRYCSPWDATEYYQYLDSSLNPVTGWQLIKGKKYYFDDEGKMLSNCVRRINGTYCLFGSDGVLVEGKTGFYKDVENRWCGWDTVRTFYNWYYFSEKGEIQTGWQKDNGKWYWFSDGWVDGYYYEDQYGKMVGYDGGVCTAGSELYYFEKGGAALIGQSGWKKTSEGDWIYLQADGQLYTGFHEINGKNYYFYGTGKLHTSGAITLDGNLYVFGPGGEQISTPGWNKVGTDYYGKSIWYYIHDDGTAHKDWYYEDGKSYMFDWDGRLVVSDVIVRVYAAGAYKGRYIFDASGALVEKTQGWYKLTGGYADRWFYFESGEVVTGYRLIGGKWYYFSEYDGEMYSNSILEIDGEYMIFGMDGARVTSTGWYNSKTEYDDHYYYINESGKIQTGWKKIGGQWYFFYTDSSEYWGFGEMAGYYGGVYDVLGDDGWEDYFFQKGGALASAGWNKKYDDWYYVDSAGHPMKGWQKIDGAWYYFGSNYKMYYDGVYMIDRRPEYFNHSGACETAVSGSNWKRVGGTLRYMVNGKYVTGWQKIGTKEYYFESNGDLRLD